ncbi:MAG: hypothetical protein ABEK50_03840, partial [bacterium]
ALAYRFDTTSEMMKTFLSNTDPDLLSRLPDEQSKKCHKIAERIMERTLDEIDFKTPQERTFSSETKDESSEILNTIRGAQRLLDCLDDQEELTRGKYGMVFREFKTYNDYFQNVDKDKVDTFLYRKLKSTLYSIRKILKTYSWSDFDESDSDL